MSNGEVDIDDGRAKDAETLMTLFCEIHMGGSFRLVFIYRDAESTICFFLSRQKADLRIVHLSHQCAKL